MLTLPKAKVLFVDDEPHILAAISRKLRRDFELVTACGSEAGLECLLNDGPFAVVVADMQMPVMDGIGFLGKVRELQPAAIRIMLTGNADQFTVRRAVEEVGISQYLTKPCSPEVISEAILKLVNDRDQTPVCT